MSTRNLKTIKKFYEIINEQNKKENIFEVPFINNFEGDTPLHLCIKKENYKSADFILSFLKNTPIDTHIRSF